jgi:hypothetical protein
MNLFISQLTVEGRGSSLSKQNAVIIKLDCNGILAGYRPCVKKQCINKVKLTQSLIKYHAMKMYGEVET